MTKTIAHYLSDLRLDLKDSGALWSDPELTRCVEKAVADYSRFVPRELSKEITVDAKVEDESFTTPTVEDTDYFVTTWDISAVNDGGTATMAKIKPDVPRPVQITITDANTSITQLVIIVKGYDADNKYIEEFFYLEGGLVQTGQHYFSLVTEVEIDEITGRGAADTVIVGTSSINGIYVQLANKPIKSGSESITGSVLDTDYEMDYAGGRIAVKASGNLVANTVYTIDYIRSRLDIDLSTIIDDLIRVDRVEYPVGQVPQKFSDMEVWGTVLTLTGGHESQKEVTDAEHLVIKYLAAHSAPNAQSPGSFPSYLDTTIQLAASAYALFIYALKQEHQVATDLASSRTALGNLATAHTLVTAALAKVIVYLTNNAGEDAKSWLTKITTDIASLRTAIVTALDATNTTLDSESFTAVVTHLGEADTALAKITTHLTTGATSSSGMLTQITTDIASLRTAITTALAAVATNLGLVFTSSLDKAATGAEALLDTGDDFIDAVNDGSRVAENYREFSQARADIANARLQTSAVYVQEAQSRLNNLISYISQASGWTEIARGFAEEAAQRISETNIIISQAQAVSIQASGYIQEAVARLDNLRTYIEQARGWIEIARGFVEEAGGHIANMDRYIAESVEYQKAAESEMGLADRFRQEGIERRNEAWAIWASPHQIAPTYALGQRSQQSS